MDNDSGTGRRSDNPPPLATVRRLRLDGYTSRSGAADDDWYETERLSGQITGRARSAAATDEPAVTPGATLVLDWRNPDPDADAGAPQRLRRSLDRRHRPKVMLRVPRPHNSLRRRRHAAAAAEVPAGEAADSTTSAAPDTSGDRDDAATPLLGFRRAPEPALPKAGPALGAGVRGRVPDLARGRGASIVAATLVAAVTATIGIAVALSGSHAKPRRAAVVGASSSHASSLGRAASALTAAVGLVEHQIAARTNTRRAAQARRSHRAAHLSRRAHRHPSKSQSAAPPPSPSPASTSSSSGSSSSSPVYSGSSSAASTGSQSVTSAPASTASTPRTQSTQPAFGQNGTLGPGRGASGTQ